MQTDVRNLGRVEYLPTYVAMQDFTAARTPDTPDALWICEHPAVYTQGLAGKSDHLLNPGETISSISLSSTKLYQTASG